MYFVLTDHADQDCPKCKGPIKATVKRQKAHLDVGELYINTPLYKCKKCGTFAI